MDTENPTQNQAVLLFRGKRYLVHGDLTVAQALKRIGLAADAHLAVRKGELLTEDLLIRAGDEIKVVAVISGGSSDAL
jgi:sulfur carrier protein ThiS